MESGGRASPAPTATLRSARLLQGAMRVFHAPKMLQVLEMSNRVIAIDPHHRRVSVTHQAPDNRHPIKFIVIVIYAFSHADIMLLNARILEEIGCFAVQDMRRQRFDSSRAKRRFKPGDQGRRTSLGVASNAKS